MSYIVFLSTKGLQMVQGNVSKNNIHISSCIYTEKSIK